MKYKQLSQKKLFFIRLTLSLLGILFIGVIVLSFFYLPYTAALEKEFLRIEKSLFRDEVSLDENTKKLIGFTQIYAEEGKRSCFANFPQKKKPGTIRIGSFGCSYTFGSEVGVTDDYPSQLQDVFREYGVNNVEVLNFGSNLYSFTQAYLLLEQLGEKYGLDYVIFGPGTFFDRESTFNHACEPKLLLLHARYIVTPTGLRLLMPLGNSPKEIRKKYSRAIPLWYYLRYDVQVPVIIQSISKNWRTFKNPFYYYRGTQQEEEAKIQRELVIKASRLPYLSRIYIVSPYPWTIKKFENIPKVALMHYTPKYYTPYRAPLDHYNHFGNRLLAETLYDWISTGKNTLLEREIKIINRPPKTMLKTKPLDQYASFSLVQNNTIFALFHSIRPGEYEPEKKAHPIEKIDTQSVLVIQKSDFLNALWIPYNKEFTGKEIISLKITTNKESKRYSLGKVQVISSHIGYFSIPSIIYSYYEKVRIDFYSLVLSGGHTVETKDVKSWDLYIDDQLIMHNTDGFPKGLLIPVATDTKNKRNHVKTDTISLQLGKELQIPLVHINVH